jgi:hypothetical protein
MSYGDDEPTGDTSFIVPIDRKPARARRAGRPGELDRSSRAARSLRSDRFKARRSAGVRVPGRRFSFDTWTSMAASIVAFPLCVRRTRVPQRSSGSGSRSSKPASASLSGRFVMPPEDRRAVRISCVGVSSNGAPARRRAARRSNHRGAVVGPPVLCSIRLSYTRKWNDAPQQPARIPGMRSRL